MKLPSVVQAALLAVVSALPGVAAQSIDDVFVVHRGSGAGSCDARRQLLDKTHFPEALALTQAALSAITNYKTSRPARDQLSAFFGIKFQPESAGYAAVDDVALGTVMGKCRLAFHYQSPATHSYNPRDFSSLDINPTLSVLYYQHLNTLFFYLSLLIAPEAHSPDPSVSFFPSTLQSAVVIWHILC